MQMQTFDESEVADMVHQGLREGLDFDLDLDVKPSVSALSLSLPPFSLEPEFENIHIGTRKSPRTKRVPAMGIMEFLSEVDPTPWAPTISSPPARHVASRIARDLQQAIPFCSSFGVTDNAPIQGLLSCIREGINKSVALAIPGKGKEGGPKEIYEDPIEKRMRLREYKVTESNPTPWKRDFGFPNFKAEILTVVASVSLAVDLDLKRIAERARNVEYNPKRFASLIMRVREPKSAALIFSSGKMVVAGTKTEAECKRAVRKYARVIQKIGYRVSIVNFEIQNISASGHLKFGVRVHDMAQDEKINKFVSYEAEIFPGLVYTLVKPKVKAIIFVTGAILMTGAKSEAEIQDALETIYPIARKHRR